MKRTVSGLEEEDVMINKERPGATCSCKGIRVNDRQFA